MALADRIYIDGIRYDVPVSAVDRKAEFLDKYAKRTENGGLKRKLIGVYYNFDITFGDTLSTAAYQKLYNKLTEPKEFHIIIVPASDGDYEYVAYISGVQDSMIAQYDGKNYFGSLKASFIAQDPARRQ